MKTRKDPNQIVRAEHQEDHDARRVYIVGGQELKLEVDSDKIAKSIQESISNVQFPEIKIPEITTLDRNNNIKVVEVPVIVPEIKVIEVEKPIVTTEIQVVEKPTIIKETKIEKIEVPVITKEVEYKLHPAYMIAITVLSISLIGCIFKIQGVI